MQFFNFYQGLYKTWEASTGCWGPNICRISGKQTTSYTGDYDIRGI